jgi:hypothetical protein
VTCSPEDADFEQQQGFNNQKAAIELLLNFVEHSPFD